MISRPPIDWLALAPSLALTAAAVISLLASVLVPARARKPVSALVCGLGFAAATFWAALLYDRSPKGTSVIHEALFRDRYGALAALLVGGAGLLTTLVFYGERRAEELAGERYALLAAAGGGMIFFAQAANLLTLFLGLEWFSISLYVLCALDRDRVEAIEAGFKYLIVGSFSSAILVFGAALVYGAGGTIELAKIADIAPSGDLLLLTGLAMILTGLAFKASAAPFHMWTPDVYQGAPTPLAGFMAAATKTVALVVALRVLVTAFPHQEYLWTYAIAVIALISLVVGNLAALVQKDVKRMLAYSSISHAGFLLLALTAIGSVSERSQLGGRALLFYLIPYGAASIGAFAVVAARERELGRAVSLDDLAGFGWERPLLGVSLWIFMLTFAGFPLTGGFIGKLYLFSAAYKNGFLWLVVVGVVATLVSLGYYLAVVRSLYMRSSLESEAGAHEAPAPAERLLATAVGIAVVVAVGSFFAAQPLIDFVRSAANQLPL